LVFSISKMLIIRKSVNYYLIVTLSDQGLIRKARGEFYQFEFRNFTFLKLI